MDETSPYRRVLRNPALRRLLIGQTVSSIGDWLYLVAVMVVVYQVTDDAVVLGIVGAARMVPFVVLSIPAGIVAGRYDRRTILLVTDLGRGLLMVVLGVLVTANASVVPIVGVTIAATCFSAFFGPAIGSYLPTVVGDERDLGPANSLWATLDNLAFFIGPAVAGLLIAAGGLGFAFLLNALSFGFVALIMLTLPGAAQGPRSPWTSSSRTASPNRHRPSVRQPCPVGAASAYRRTGPRGCRDQHLRPGPEHPAGARRHRPARGGAPGRGLPGGGDGVGGVVAGVAG